MKRIFTALLILSALLLAGCGAKEPAAQLAPPAAPSAEPAQPEQPAEPAPTEIVYSFDGLEIPVPVEYEDLLFVESEPEAWNEHWTPLISFGHKASIEAYQRDYPGVDPSEDEGIGWICTVMQLDRIGFEDWLSGERSGSTLFAKDSAEHYYMLSCPTDVRVYKEDSAWTELNEWSTTLPRTIIERNGLTAYDASDLFAADYTYRGEHVDLGYRLPGQPMDLIVLSLSQPAKQGKGGIWCVERVRYVYSDYSFTDTQLVFPVSYGVDEAASSYYARLQAECDAGEHPELLTASGAALDYAKRAAWIFGEDVSDTDFERLSSFG